MRRTCGLNRVCACGRPSGNRERCSRCLIRRHRGTEFPPGSCCAACSLADLRVLRWLQLVDGRVAACGNCTTLAGRRRITLAELVAEVLASSWGQRVA